MPFLKAGFNARNTDTGIRGWTRHVRGKQFAPAELRRWQCGDYFWIGERHGKGTFIVWGEFVVGGSHYGFDLAWEYQNGLAHSDIDTREETPAWGWVEERRRKLAAGEAIND